MTRPKTKLSKSMTVSEFENGYWYADEVKAFAQTLGLEGVARLRKDEIERSIIGFLKTGKVELPTKRDLSKTGIKDLEHGLSLDLPVVNYTSNKETKSFLVAEAQKKAPGLKKRSGARYRLNRWREEQLTAGKAITYGDLVDKYIELNSSDEPFKKVPSGRYINFMSDFLAGEKASTREAAIAAWKELKTLDIPKNYPAWVEYRTKMTS